MGNGFVEQPCGFRPDLFNANYLGVDLRNNSYVLSRATRSAPLIFPGLSARRSRPMATYGVQSLCLWTNDVLLRTPGLSAQTQNALAYENAGPGPFPLLSSVSKSHTSLKPWISLVDGWDMINLRNRFDTTARVAAATSTR
jgi:hypothetical protein